MIGILQYLAILTLALWLVPAELRAGAPPKHRVLVSTDIGGTDPDDDQSMVHLLACADSLDIEGLVSSPYGPGRKKDILEVIEAYEQDYPNLKRHSSAYPSADALRAITRQGALDSPGPTGTGAATEGSRWLVECARRADPRPLHVLVWGGVEDLAQALHDAPDILPGIRVHFIGGPNKTWSVDAYRYIERNHPDLWIIESNSTYRGWFVGGDQDGDWGNRFFVSRHVAGHGAMGDYFAGLLNGTIKMGDSPSVGWLLQGNPADPAGGGWGGRYVRVWEGRDTRFERLTTEADAAEVFGVVEFALPVPEGFEAKHRTKMVFDGRIPAEGWREGGSLCFRFSPRDAKVWSYRIESDLPGLDGKQGSFTAAAAPAGRSGKPSSTHPNWWTDDPDPAAAEGVHAGAKTVSSHRREFLEDFASRMDRCLRAAVP